MGFNKRFLPEVQILEEKRKELGNDLELLKLYLYGVDSFIGSSDSLHFLKKIEKQLHDVER